MTLTDQFRYLAKFEEMVVDMDHTEAWVTLDLISCIGPKSAQRLLEIFKTPENILSAPISKIKETGFLNAAQLKSLAGGPDRGVEKAFTTLKAHGARAVGFDDRSTGLEADQALPLCCTSRDLLQTSVRSPSWARAPSPYGRETAFSWPAA